MEYLFWQCEKHIALSEKKATFNVPISAQYAQASLIFGQCKNCSLQFELKNHFVPLHQPTSILHVYKLKVFN